MQYFHSVEVGTGTGTSSQFPIRPRVLSRLSQAPESDTCHPAEHERRKQMSVNNGHFVSSWSYYHHTMLGGFGNHLAKK